jgi:hypothetical protein
MSKRKTCCTCHKSKSLSSFYKETASKDGLQRSCKPCQIKSSVKWNKANSDRHKENHYRYIRGTVSGFLGALYCQMRRRVEGRASKDSYLWEGKPIMPRETFLEWGRNHPDFLRLFRRWTLSGRDRKLVPSINRIDPGNGYTLDNVEWVTASQNSSLAGSVRSFSKRRAVYALLGDKNGQGSARKNSVHSR